MELGLAVFNGVFTAAVARFMGDFPYTRSRVVARCIFVIFAPRHSLTDEVDNKIVYNIGRHPRRAKGDKNILGADVGRKNARKGTNIFLIAPVFVILLGNGKLG